MKLKIDALEDGYVVEAGSPTWRRAYRDRVAVVCRVLVWLGYPSPTIEAVQELLGAPLNE